MENNNVTNAKNVEVLLDLVIRFIKDLTEDEKKAILKKIVTIFEVPILTVHGIGANFVDEIDGRKNAILKFNLGDHEHVIDIGISERDLFENKFSEIIYKTLSEYIYSKIRREFKIEN